VVSDGTAAGTQPVKQIYQGNLTNFGDGFFGIDQLSSSTSLDRAAPGGLGIWRSDGTAKRHLPLPASVNTIMVHPRYGIRRYFYFTVIDELPRGDLADRRHPCGDCIVPQPRRRAGPTQTVAPHSSLAPAPLCFQASEGSYAQGLWRTDGTMAGTFEVLPATDVIQL